MGNQAGPQSSTSPGSLASCSTSCLLQDRRSHCCCCFHSRSHSHSHHRRHALVCVVIAVATLFCECARSMRAQTSRTPCVPRSRRNQCALPGSVMHLNCFVPGTTCGCSSSTPRGTMRAYTHCKAALTHALTSSPLSTAM